MKISQPERTLLRNLAKQVAEIAAAPEQALRREWWKRHNRLEKVKPMVLCFPEGSWVDLLPESVLVTSDPFWREWEWHLRSIIYRDRHLRDDNVIDPVLKVPLVWSDTGWGIPIKTIASSNPRGALRYAPQFKTEEDAARLRTPEIQVDEKRSQENLEAVGEVFGDLLEVKQSRTIEVDTSLVRVLCRMRGLDQVMVDALERPAWLHGVLRLMLESTRGLLDWVEENGYLSLNNRDDYVGSGGVGYTHELPQPDFAGRVRLRDLWGFAETQEFTQVSPAMYEEFAVEYQIPLLERFGLNCYACCESLNDKMRIVKRIPRLRRLSVSPWTDVRIAAEALGDRCIFSWKPNPTDVVAGFHEDRIRASIAETLKAAEGCVLEMILADTHTVEGEPWRLERWVHIAQAMTTA
jgi:hypothetical protein